ncbi:nucleolar protein 11-like [Haliotis rufescens]|uniref:nucleolar protein 11-like n=1 Tax=Haliotis rufescens TaxID=6454 RepID=UPI00201F4610|nr:nucleolar protein 11-like [Haliotis rufescens]
MAALADGFSLAKLSEESALIGIEKGEKPNAVIITSKTGFINEYKLSDQKLTRSWSLRHGIQITCPTVWSPTKEEYLTVQNKQQLKSWTSDTTNFDKAKKKHIGADIVRILVETDFLPIVVCENGRVDFQANIKDSCSTGTLAQEEAILWCQSYICAGSVCVVLVTRTQDQLVRVHRHTYLSDAECWSLKTTPLSLSADALLSCCLSLKAEPSLLSLWQDGRLLDLPLTGSSNMDDSQEVATISGVQTDSCMIYLDHTHIAVAGIRQNTTVGLGIYNVKFQALQSWQPFPEPLLTRPKLFCHYGHLFLACNKTLYAFPYKCEPSTVARLLGQRDKVKDTGKVTDLAHGVVSWSTKQKPAQKAAGDLEIENLFTSLIDKTKTKAKEKFESELRKLVNLLSKSVNRQWIVSSHMSQLCQTCFSLTAFWPRAEVQQLIQHRLISNSDQSSLYQALADHKEILLMHQSFSVMPDVAEDSLVKSLCCYLDISDEECTEECESLAIADEMLDTSEDVTCPICSSKAVLLNRLLCLPFNDVFLVDSLRKLPFKNVLTVLEYLYYLLKVLPLAGQPRTGVPALSKVIDWISLLIDAHVTQLIVSPDARMLLGNLHEVVGDQVEFCNQLATLEAVLSQFKKKCTPVSQQKVGSYCIEVLHVR